MQWGEFSVSATIAEEVTVDLAEVTHFPRTEWTLKPSNTMFHFSCFILSLRYVI